MFFNKNKTLKRAVTLSLIAATSLFSCEDFLDETPESFTTNDTFFTSNDALEGSLTAAYAFLRVTYRNRYFQWGDLRSDSFAPDSDNERRLLHNSVMDPANGGLLSWNDPYKAIDGLNRVILESADIPDADDYILAQAYAMRAKLYFDLVRVWGNIPVFTEPSTIVGDVFQNVTPAARVFSEVIIPDMNLANRLVPDTEMSSEFRFSKSSILALRGEVYLWLGENELALEALTELEELGTHSLVTTPEAWEELFSNQAMVPRFLQGRGKLQRGPELIFSIPFNDPVGEISSSVLSLYAGGARVTVMSTDVEEKWLERFPIDSTWEDLYPDTPPVFTITERQSDGSNAEVPLYGDWRHFATRENGTFEEGFGNIDIGEARIEKWQEERSGLSNGQDDTDIVVYRYADIILMIAEAELKLGNTEQALARINEIRVARQLPTATATDFGNDFDSRLDYLLDERQFELFAEGKRWWDLVRNDRAVQTLNPLLSARSGDEGFIPLTEARVLWPIFNNHLTANPLLSQNPEW